MKKIVENKKILLVLAVVVVLVLALGGTYAWIQFSLSSDKRNVLRAGTLSLKLDKETEDGIYLANAYPMTEEEGLATKIYTFTLVNDGDIDSNYSIYLDDLPLSEGKKRMDSHIVKYRFQKEEEQSTTGLVSSLGESPNRLLDSGVLPKKESINYQLQVWMDYEAGNSEQGTSFKANLRIEANQIADKTS